MSSFALGRVSTCSLTTLMLLLIGQASAQELFLTDGQAFPGQLWLGQSGTPERSLHRRQSAANPAYPRAAMKLSQTAAGVDGKLFFVSGLDGGVFHFLDGRHEIQSFEFVGQVRDIACTGEDHVVYFSVVPTPQNNEPLSDGKIYRRDLWDGRPAEIATVRQADVGGNWCGAFTIKGGVTHIATFESPSRLFALTSNGPQAEFPNNRWKIQGLAATPEGAFLVADGSHKIYRTRDFTTFDVVFEGQRPFTDVAVRP